MSDQDLGTVLTVLMCALVFAFSCWVLWSEQKARRIDAARNEWTSRTLAHIADVDPDAFTRREGTP